MNYECFCGWCRSWKQEAEEIKYVFPSLKRREYFNLNCYRYICRECIFELTGEIWGEITAKKEGREWMKVFDQDRVEKDPWKKEE